eukprot:Awhi_evm1s1386
MELSNNPIPTIHPKAFAGLTELESLSLALSLLEVPSVVVLQNLIFDKLPRLQVSKASESLLNKTDFLILDPNDCTKGGTSKETRIFAEKLKTFFDTDDTLGSPGDSTCTDADDDVNLILGEQSRSRSGNQYYGSKNCSTLTEPLIDCLLRSSSMSFTLVSTNTTNSTSTATQVDSTSFSDIGYSVI